MVEAMGRALTAYNANEKSLRLFHLPENPSVVENIIVPKVTGQKTLRFAAEDSTVKKKSYCHSFISHMTVMCERNKRKYEVCIENELKELAKDPKTAYYEFKLDFNEPFHIISIADAVEERIAERDISLKRSDRTFEGVLVPQVLHSSEQVQRCETDENNQEEIEYSSPPSPLRVIQKRRRNIMEDTDTYMSAEDS